MSHRVYAWYAGFKTTPAGREYRFVVESGEKEPREFRLTISDEVWLSNNARHHDGPAVCGHRLLRELASNSYHGPITHCGITSMELEEYRLAHIPD